MHAPRRNARPNTRRATRPAALLLTLALGASLSACGTKEAEDPAPATTPAATSAPSPSVTPSAAATASAAPQIAVAAADTSCDLDKTSVPGGVSVLNITNKGSKVTEVYVIGDVGDNERVVAERESIGAGESAAMTVELTKGDYEIRCKPGTMDDAARSKLTVTEGQGFVGTPETDAAVASYKDYIAAQVDDTIAATKTFVEAVKAGDLEKAKELYAPSRVGWESIEPVAESFGDIDPKVDLREADLEDGDTWTGWHKIEKALWETGTTKEMGPVGDQLLADLDELRRLVPTAEITPTSMANGAKELLDEVASGKITGEEEAFSHTDLVDFKANLDGAKKVYDLLKPALEKKDQSLASTLTEEFDDVSEALSKYEEGDGYVSYEKVTEAERKTLTDVVNALAEPLSKLAAAIVS